MKCKAHFKNLVAVITLVLLNATGYSQATGSFKGKLIEQVTKQPLAGATVRLDNTQFGAATDSMGVFTIVGIPIGSYSVTISNMGFQTKNLTDIIITTNKTYYAEIALIEETSKLGEVTVASRRFKGENNPLTPVSTFSLSREEIFRNPASAGDIMRALAMLPGVTSSGSQFSAIAARGQGTTDNVYMIDDIPMFNISHLEAEGLNSGFNDPNGGRYSIFAPKVIDNVTFQNGGFDATNGRRSSSSLELSVKEGNKASWSFTGQLELLGVTLIADGPLSKKTSVFATARYINFAALTSGLSIGSISLGDYLIKTTTELNKNNKLSFIAMFNPERPYRNIEDVKTGGNINEDNSPGDLLFNHTGSRGLIGLNLRSLIGSKSVWKNVLYYRTSSVDNNFGRFTLTLDADGIILDAQSGRYINVLRNIINNQQEAGYRSILTKKYDKLTLTAGIDAIVVNLDYSRRLTQTDTLFTFKSSDIRANPSQFYQVVTPSQFNVSFDDAAFSGAGYVSLSWRPSSKITLNPGVRFDYFGFNERSHVSPRLSGSIHLNEKHSINFATGIYFQEMAYADVAAQSAATKLKNEETVQAILGYKFQISPDLKLVAEGWHKRFYDVVVQPNRYQSALNNDGTGHAYGADLTIIKRLSKKFYGQAGYSYMVSKRDDHNGLGEYDYTFSVPHSINLLASYKPNNKWLFSAKFRYSTGRPTDEYIVHSNVLNDPNNLAYSKEITVTNGARLEDYITLDVRVDYNKQMKKGVFSAFVDLANVNNRFNVADKVFVSQTGKPYNVGFGILPSIGIRLEY